jgi:hypothetical protein
MFAFFKLPQLVLHFSEFILHFSEFFLEFSNVVALLIELFVL